MPYTINKDMLIELQYYNEMVEIPTGGGPYAIKIKVPNMIMFYVCRDQWGEEWGKKIGYMTNTIFHEEAV